MRTRLSVAARDGATKEEGGYDFYPDRRHLEEEFDAIWEAQASFAPELLTSNLRDALRETIFFQRPLKAPKVGLCFLTGETRVAKAHPSTQRRVLYETVNALRVVVDGEAERGLTREERDRAIHMIDNRKEVKGPAKVTLKALAKELKLPRGARFTLATATRDAIACDPVRAALGHSTRLGGLWSGLDTAAQWDVVSRVRSVETESEFAALVDWIIDQFGIEKERAVATANAPLPEGYARLSLGATEAILAKLEDSVITYDKAVASCGWKHSDGRTGEVLDELPYYGDVLDRHVIPGSGEEKDSPVERFGRITNPTVHIGLGQLRRLVNRIIEVHGKPDEIVVELARDLKLSEAQKQEANRRNNANRADAERRSAQLQELGQLDNGTNRMLLRLWEDLGPAIGPRACPYTGKAISVEMLFDGSCDVDHILPYSRTLDDGFANRTVCLRQANRDKRDRSPWEVWGETPRWPTIEANLKNLPENKRWRFGPDAMVRFEGERDFLDRALVDTQYLSRLARTYLETLYDGADGKMHVWVVPGRMTEMLRRHWGLNFDLGVSEDGTVKSKNRTDHRHHAIDAAVVAATDRSLLQAIQKASGRDEGQGESAERVARDTADPWEGFRIDVRAQVDRIVVSHRADHGIDPKNPRHGKGATVGALHEATALGIVNAADVVTRVDLMSLKPGHLIEGGRGDTVRDPHLRMSLAETTEGTTGKAFEQALKDFAREEGPYQGIRRIRIVKKMQERARVPVPRDAPTKVYQGGANHRFEIWRLPDGKLVPQVVTAWEVHNLSVDKKPHSAAKRMLSVHRGDMVRLTFKGDEITGLVQKSDIANGLFIVPHNEANADARTNDKADPFRWIQISARPAVAAGIRRVQMDEIGRIRDPGPPR